VRVDAELVDQLAGNANMQGLSVRLLTADVVLVERLTGWVRADAELAGLQVGPLKKPQCACELVLDRQITGLDCCYARPV
jgi:hypothetical protein